ncbi:MAG: oxidoreductase [Bacteroidetes bacterium]|nr:oxidoreductase [Bacteroidota bacterium]
MLQRLFFNIFCLFLILNSASAQTIQMLNTDGELSFRGLSVVDDDVVWVSGSKGTVGKSIDGGKTFQWMKVKGYEQCDFRDIEAFSKDVAIIMSIAEPAYILKTTNGGRSWKKVYENATKGMFLDAMDFFDEKHGVVIGDPINGFFFIAQTKDGGKTWKETFHGYYLTADSSEACFASSGTNIRLFSQQRFGFVSGGMFSRFCKGNEMMSIPILQGGKTTGANSFAFKDSLTIMVVGGDFSDLQASPTCVFTNDGGKTWTTSTVPPSGYKSCVEFLEGNTWICCGLSGVDISNDNGKTWTKVSTDSFHACRKAKKGNGVYFSGAKSRIGKMIKIN